MFHNSDGICRYFKDKYFITHTHTIRDLWMLQIKHLLFKDTLESVLAVRPMSFQNYKRTIYIYSLYRKPLIRDSYLSVFTYSEYFSCSSPAKESILVFYLCWSFNVGEKIQNKGTFCYNYLFACILYKTGFLKK